MKGSVLIDAFFCFILLIFSDIGGETPTFFDFYADPIQLSFLPPFLPEKSIPFFPSPLSPFWENPEGYGPIPLSNMKRMS